MGPLSSLLLLPVMGPVWGCRLVLDRLVEEAESRMYDENRGFADLIELSMQRNAGKITEAEFAEQETAVLERLSSIRESEYEYGGEYEGEDEGEYESESEGEGKGEDEFAGRVEYEPDGEVAQW